MTDEDDRISMIHAQLGIPDDYARHFPLPRYAEATLLTPLGVDCFGRDQFATPETAHAWRSMRSAAQSDNIELLLVSAFRSIDYQANLIRKKLEAGQPLSTILRSSAAPGHSEHHSGRAIDISTPAFNALETEFDQSEAFIWLQQHAYRFDFQLSYPLNNPTGISYEPWHWCHGSRP